MSPILLNVRYFAAARAAVGMDTEVLLVAGGSTFDALIIKLLSCHPELRHLLPRCSFLYNGVAVRDRSQVLDGNHTVDVLPPFAGG